jgi:hypothetical protein
VLYFRHPYFSKRKARFEVFIAVFYRTWGCLACDAVLLGHGFRNFGRSAVPSRFKAKEVLDSLTLKIEGSVGLLKHQEPLIHQQVSTFFREKSLYTHPSPENLKFGTAFSPKCLLLEYSIRNIL